MDDKAIKRSLVIFYLIALEFYRPSFIGNVEDLSRYLFDIVGLLLFFYTTFFERRRSLNISIFGKLGFYLLILSMFTSIYMAYVYSNQSLSQGFSSTLPYVLSYLSLPILFKTGVNRTFLESSIKCFAVITMVLIAVNFVFYPTAIFGSADISEGRGGLVRVRMTGMMTIAFFLYYSIHRYTLFKNRKHLKWILLCSIFILLSLTRQLIALCILFGVLLYLKDLSTPKKVAILTVLSLIMFYVIPQITLFKGLFEQTNNQLNSDTDDVRLIAWNYYTQEAQPDPDCYVWGTGVPNANSKYGKSFYSETTDLKVFIVDVGYGGFYYLFGLVGILGLLILLFSQLFVKTFFMYFYVKFFIITNLLMGFTSGVIIYRSEVMLLMISIYLLAYKYEHRHPDFKF